MTLIYDAGVLIAADRDDRRVWAAHRARLDFGLVPITTAPAVAQASRSARQAQLHRFLRGCAVVAFMPVEAHAVGSLLERDGTADVVDAHLVLVAATSGATVLTSDVEDISSLSSRLPSPVRVLPV